MTVAFASLRTLERAENLKSLWDAYDGDKEAKKVVNNAVKK